MSENNTTWHSHGAWHRIIEPGRLGRTDGEAGVVVTPIEHLGIATVIGSHGKNREIADSFNTQYGIMLPTEPGVSQSEACTALWSGPEQWLVLSHNQTLVSRLAEGFRNVAAVSDQSDARAVIRLSGPNIRHALSKGCAIDIDRRSFPAGATAVTAIALIGVQLWRLPHEDSIHVALFRSMAQSFWDWLRPSAAEFGIAVAAPARSNI